MPEDYPGPRFRHFDEEPWREVRALQRGEERLSIREKFMEVGPKAMSIVAHYDAGMAVHKHGHHSHHIVYVMGGSLVVGDRPCPAGTHITLDEGAAFGPIVAGEEGADLFEVMCGDPRSWPADPDGFVRYLADNGLEKVPARDFEG